MDSPINRMIDSVQSRTPAVSKNIEKNKKSLNQKVVELVASANRTALPDRQVVPRNALIVMARAMKELSSLPDESREAGVIREVNKFISLNQNTFRSIDTYGKHTDLLPAGHPLSDHNASLSTEDYLKRYASWLSADPGISDDVRHLVAAAYSQLPGSLEREHAFARLNAVKASALPAYFKIDISALVAAFSFGDGNSSAARRARVKLQWRDRFGKWIEMGRGVNFKARLSNGNVVTVAGTYVGSDSNAGYSGNWARKEANAGLVEVKGDVNIPDGIYSVSNSNAESFKARLSESELERAGVDTPKKSKYKLSSQFDESIPDLNDILATKVDGPSGWTKNEDGSFTSDDDYKVIKKDDGYEVYRLDPEGKTGDKVGDAKTWADVQNVAAADEEAYDKYKEDVESGQLPLGDGERPEPRYSRMNRQVQEEIRQLKGQIPQNQESNQRIESQLERALSGKDSQGRDLPEGWYSEIDPSQFSETYYKDIPGATRKDERLVAVVGSEGKINYGTGGFWFNNAKPAESWDQITEDTPKIIDQINASRARIGLDPIGSSELGDFTQLSKKDYQNIRSKVDSTRNRLYTQDGFAFSRNETGFGGYDDSIVVTTEDWEPGDPEIAKIESDGGIDWSNDAMYDTWADSLRRAISTGSPTDQISDKEIFDRRMAGESLQEVADSLGIPREEVRAREAKYARENPQVEPDIINPMTTTRTPDLLPVGDVKQLDLLVDNTWRVDALDDTYEVYKDKNGDLTLRAVVEDGTKGGVVYSGQTYLDVANILDDGKVIWKNNSLREEHKDNFILALNSMLFFHDINAGRPRPKDFIYFDGETGETIDTLLTSFYEGQKEYFDNLVEKVHAAGGSIEEEELSEKELKSLLTRPSGTVFRVFLPKNISDDTLKDVVKAGSIDGVDDDDESVQQYVDIINEQRGGGGGDGDGDAPDEPPTPPSGVRIIRNKDGRGIDEVIYTNSVKKSQNDPYSDVFMDFQFDTDNDYEQPWEEVGATSQIDYIVKIANKFGIHVEESPDQSSTYRGDEIVYRFTRTGDPLTPEQVEEFMGSEEFPEGIFGAVFDDARTKEEAEGLSWESLYEAMTGKKLSGEPVEGPDEPPFNYKSAKAIVFDKNKSVQERYAAVFDGARGENIVEYVERQGIDVSMLDSSIPKDAEVVFADDDGLYVTLRYPDGVYYYSELDSDSKNSVKAKRLDSNDEEVATSTEYIQELFNTDGLPYDRGGFIDKDRQSEMQDGNDSDGDAPDEPPTPPSGGTPPKSPAPSSPAAPALFREFDVPAGAFNLRTVEYEPEGRVDEASTDFTDAPNRLAVRFPLDTLVRAFTQSLIGDVDENVVEDIVDINDDGDGNLPDLSEVGDMLQRRMPRADVGRATGAGALEFNAGDEFVPAEALYNAVWLAGGDPNRVIANAYDAANGNRNNLSKLIEAQGGVPTPEEEKLITDITDEIRQIDDATADGERSPAVVNVDKNDEMKFPGSLIENVPVDFSNPDYYLMDLSPYVATILEPDELGYTDNPQYIAVAAESADLIQQMLKGITDGTGMALIRFNDDSTSEVPVEAIRDALQYQGVNTNNVLFNLNAESNNLVDEEKRQPEEQEPTESEEPAVALNYPGPRLPGYRQENTTLDVNGNVIAEGARVSATKDGKTGRVVSVQNDPEYVRILFDDGKTAVRSATKVEVISNADGSAPAVAPEVTRPSAPTPSTDVSERLDRPDEVAPRIARAGETVGVNDLDSKIPDEISDLTQKDVPQTKFVEWGARDAEIAKAANTRVKIDELEKAVRETAAARETRDRDKLKAAQDRLNIIAADTYGSREGISFGAEYYSLKLSAAQAYGYGNAEEILSGAKNTSMEVSFDVLDQSGANVGTVRREIAFKIINNVDGTKTKVVTASNSFMKVTGKNKKKGFASAYNRYMENWYIANDVKKVQVFAAGGREYQGGFVWALNGFGWSSDRSPEIKEILNKVSRNAKNADEKAIASRLLAKLSDSYNKDTGKYDLSKAPTPMEIALVGWYPGATDWVGKSVMTQTSWNGVKNLVPSAREQVQARNYNQIKNAERRVQAGQNKPNVSSELIAYVTSNAFQTDNPQLSAYTDQIRNALKNNDPLGKLSPDAKSALSNYVSAEMINKDSKVKIEDTFKLRNALNAEYRADHAYSDPFQVGTALTEFTSDDFENNPAKIENAGYTYRELAVDESGMNSTWEVTHTASGQVFYVKKEELSRNWNRVRGITGELETSVLMNAMGMNGTYAVRGSTNDEDLIIMSRAGANLPIAMEPVNASRMLRSGLTSPDGEKYYGDSPKQFMKDLKNPEDILRMSILDMLGNNKDRHDGNWMVAYDTTDNKLVIFPVDNSLSVISTDQEQAEDQMISFLGDEWREDVGNIYQNNMPGLVALAGKDRAYAMYKNEVQKIIDNMGSEIVKPKGEELAALIDKWGTYDAFKDAMTARLKNLITDGTALNRELRSALTLGYWG